MIIGANTPPITPPTFAANHSSTRPEEPKTTLSPDKQGEVTKTDGRSNVSETNLSKNSGTPGKSDLSQAEQTAVAELKKIDRQVRSHEAAHMAAAGGLAKGGARYSYQKGPDGQHYAVGGEVSIDTSGVTGNPEATLAKANIIQAAALAPADPSSQDRAVAAGAAQMAAAARAEIAAEKKRENSNDSDKPETSLSDNQQRTIGISLYQTTQQNSETPRQTGSSFQQSA